MRNNFAEIFSSLFFFFFFAKGQAGEFFDNLKCRSKRKIDGKTKRNFNLLTTTCQNRLFFFPCYFRLPKINTL